MAARVFASVLDWRRPVPASDGQLIVRLEFVPLDGVNPPGKLAVLTTLTNERQLAADLIDALVAHLNGLYSGQAYNHRDVILWGS